METEPEAEPQRHKHYYRHDIKDWWCSDCQTVTDYCTEEVDDLET